ncbi:MAG: hypothetical protein PG980_000568 [Wolbachia endosymbiont of Ctenocephalides felis wCfeJ]|uniref:hypothetical protein n=1 Tax=Wolbachia endosymbiont of Ctenocephalides felis wCfeJ TaxID=2732594 RepID=UPI001FEA1D71|nr:hypothetical protein [Wolbachia endosymbiont of Ctenocephalides felis wCfeJ]WCR58096.1 MAG: hypothetical protein PG980_000568 [Wolbachia endosymbiont of Ctenocephalides felis wCfeJ]
MRSIKDVSEKQKSKFVKYYFDYPYFARIVNSEFFKEELKSEAKKFGTKIVLLWLFPGILSAASNVLLYLAYKNQKPKKVLIGLACTSIVLSILAAVCFVVFCLWMFFDFVKKRFVVHRIKNFLENEVSPEWIRLYKEKLTKKTCNQSLEKDIEDIIEFLLEEEKVVALYNFLTNGQDLIQAGVAMVNMLLVHGVDPNNIVLDANSLGGGIAAEVLKRFEDQGIYLTLIHSNSYSSLKDATNNFPHGVGDFFTRWLPAKFLNFWFTRCGLDFNARKIIENTKCPVLITGRKGDTVIPEEAQLVNKLDDLSGERLRRNIVLEHNPNVPCKNQNIHSDYKEHLVHYENNGSVTKHEDIEDKFIQDAHEYLVDKGLNKKFNLNDYIGSAFSRNLTDIKLEPLKALKSQNEGYMQV